MKRNKRHWSVSDEIQAEVGLESKFGGSTLCCSSEEGDIEEYKPMILSDQD